MLFHVCLSVVFFPHGIGNLHVQGVIVAQDCETLAAGPIVGTRCAAMGSDIIVVTHCCATITSDKMSVRIT